MLNHCGIRLMCVLFFLQLNELRSHIMVIDHRTMAASAELSVAQAVALSLQQEIKEKEIQVRGGGGRSQLKPWDPDARPPLRPPAVFLVVLASIELKQISHLSPVVHPQTQVILAFCTVKQIGRQTQRQNNIH